MAELGVRLQQRHRADAAQLCGALAAALCLHVLLAVFVHINFTNIAPLHVPSVIEVRLVRPTQPQDKAPQNQKSQDPSPQSEQSIAIKAPPENVRAPEETPPKAAPQSAPENPRPTPPQTLPEARPQPRTPPTFVPPPIINSESGTSRGAFPDHRPEGARNYIHSEWALEPPLKDERLKGLGLLEDAECLRSLSVDCAALRKEVFAEFELTEMEKVWTPARADTGMSSEFYGLSEREIRLKIGSKIAGENGLMILPGIAIDGQLWDMINGVKKGCEMKRGINSEGRYGVVRVCPKSLPAARDRKYYIPPKP